MQLTLDDLPLDLIGQIRVSGVQTLDAVQCPHLMLHEFQESLVVGLLDCDDVS